MKKQAKKLVLAKETLQMLDQDFDRVEGGTVPIYSLNGNVTCGRYTCLEYNSCYICS